MRAGSGAALRAAALAGAVAVLVLAGRGELAAPPLSASELDDWLAARDTATAALALVRVAALAVAAWLALAATVAWLARAVGAVRLAAAAERGLPSRLRAATAASLVAVAVASPAAAQPAGGDDHPPRATGTGTATMRVLVEAPPAPATSAPRPESTAPEPQPTAPATSAPRPDPTAPPEHEAGVPTSASDPEPAAAPDAVASPDPAPAHPVVADEEWVVEPGESFWSMAEEIVADALGRPPTDAEVAPYWARLIEANRDRLVSADPDLILPGQVFVVPPVTPAP